VADEEDDSCAHVSYQEDEGVIGAEDNDLFEHARGHCAYGDTGRGGGFGTLL